MALPWEDEEEQFQPRKAGRPKGSPNKSLDQKQLVKHFDDIYDLVAHMMTQDEREYYQRAFSGQQSFDVLKDARLLAKLMSVYVTTTIARKLVDGSPSKEVAENVGQYRQLLVNIFDMEYKVETQKAKKDESRDMVDPTRESNVARFKGLHRESAQG